MFAGILLVDGDRRCETGLKPSGSFFGHSSRQTQRQHSGGSATPWSCDSGLLVLKEYSWIDLGFRFAQPYWGRGLATEVASAWVRAAFDEFGLSRLGAFVHPENHASIRVLGKLGFKRERRGTVFGMDSITFFLDVSTRDALH